MVDLSLGLEILGLVFRFFWFLFSVLLGKLGEEKKNVSFRSGGVIVLRKISGLGW